MTVLLFKKQKSSDFKLKSARVDNHMHSRVLIQFDCFDLNKDKLTRLEFELIFPLVSMFTKIAGVSIMDHLKGHLSNEQEEINIDDFSFSINNEVDQRIYYIRGVLLSKRIILVKRLDK